MVDASHSDASGYLARQTETEAMHTLQADIDWHLNEIRLTRGALADADQPSNVARKIEVEVLSDRIARRERTLGPWKRSRQIEPHRE